MRRKLYLGLSLAAFAGLVAGGLFFTQSIGAQDPPKKAEPEQKKDISDLFDILKKDLELKKDAPGALPPLTLPPPVATPTPEPKPVVIPPPTVIDAPKKEVPLPTPPKVDDKKTDLPSFPSITTEKPTEPKPPVIVNQPAPKELPKPSIKPDLDLPTKASTTTINPPAVQISPPDVKGPPLPPLSKPDSPPTVQVPQQRPAIDIVKNTSSPWSLHIEMVDGQTIVTATVNKKHEFKIICGSLDLQTGKGMLKATGKVQISGDMINGNCDTLAISLLEDRLLLEGSAAVTIQKVSTNVSDAKPAAFELKGEKLDLRISELQAGKLLQANWSRTDEPARSAIRTVAMTTQSKNWTPYGILRRIEAQDPFRGDTGWSLVDQRGVQIAVLVARDGGTLAQYEGQRISVYGTAEQISGLAVLRVTHIALP